MPGLSAAGIQASANTTETLLLEGLAGDERWLGGVEVCDTLQGYESCQAAEMLFFSDVLTNTVGRAALSVDLADEASWSLERSVNLGIEGATVPFTVTAYDAVGNGTQLSFAMLIDTLAPTVTLTAQPVAQIAFDGAFALSGTATDRAGVGIMELEVFDPRASIATIPSTWTTRTPSPLGGSTNAPWAQRSSPCRASTPTSSWPTMPWATRQRSAPSP